MAVRRFFEIRSANVTCSFAKATNDGVGPEIQKTMAEHAQEEELRMGESKLQSRLI